MDRTGLAIIGRLSCSSTVNEDELTGFDEQLVAVDGAMEFNRTTGFKGLQ